MSGKTFIAAVAAVLITATFAQAGPQKITTSDAFSKAVVGKTMTAGKGSTVVIKADGTFSGTLAGEPITSGAWQWKGNQFCRSDLLTKKKKFPGTCQSLTLNGKILEFSGTNAKWEIQ